MTSSFNKRKAYSIKLRSKSSLEKRILINKTGRHIYLTLVDDSCKHVLKQFSTLPFAKDATNKNYCNISFGKKLAEQVAPQLKEVLGDKVALFDRRKHKYHGVVREVAEKLREFKVIA